MPVAHAPIEGTITEWPHVTDPRLAAEIVSIAYLHCVLKGLHRAPRLIPFEEARPGDLTVDDMRWLLDQIDDILGLGAR